MSKSYFWYRQKRRKRKELACTSPVLPLLCWKGGPGKNLLRPTQHPSLHCSSCSHSSTPWVFSVVDLKYAPQHLRSYTPGWGSGKSKKESFAPLNYFWTCRKVCIVSRTHFQCLYRLLLPSVKRNKTNLCRSKFFLLSKNQVLNFLVNLIYFHYNY